MEEYARIPLQDWRYVNGQVAEHNSALRDIRRELANIRLTVEDLTHWKEDSKVQAIAALKGQVRRYEKVRDRILYTLLFGGMLELIRVGLEKWVHL